MPHSESRLHGLYAITDEKLLSVTQFHFSVEQALQGGAGIVQYRDKSNDLEKRNKQATALRTLCDQYGALLIINDDLALARLANADGIHLGENDATVSQARRVLGDRAIIGVSCYNQLGLAIKAEGEGASYVAFGAFFPSPVKPEARTAELNLIADAKQKLTVPVCAIGGININNAQKVFDAGADMVAIISGVFAQPDIKTVSRQISSLTNRENGS
jgi:thiamine-phosphate pyrophosphorylase